jgi:hypothetical protein
VRHRLDRKFIGLAVAPFLAARLQLLLLLLVVIGAQLVIFALFEGTPISALDGLRARFVATPLDVIPH